MNLTKVPLNTSFLTLYVDEENGVVFHHIQQSLYYLPSLQLSLLIALDEFSSDDDAMAFVADKCDVKLEQLSEQVQIATKYSGYIKRQLDEIAKTARHANKKLPDSFDYSAVNGLSNEVRQKLIDVKPETIGQAGRISGVTPAAVSLLLVHLKKTDSKNSFSKKIA